MGKKITKEVTLGVLESIVEGKAKFKKWGNFSDIEIAEQKGYVPDMKDKNYLEQLKARMADRVRFVEELDKKQGGFDRLPADALKAIKKVYSECK